MHLLSSEKISFSTEICWKCLEHSVVFPVELFWSNLHLMFPPIPFNWNSRVCSFFWSILGIKTFFLEGFKVFSVVLMKDKSLHIKNRKVWSLKSILLFWYLNDFLEKGKTGFLFQINIAWSMFTGSKC